MPDALDEGERLAHAMAREPWLACPLNLLCASRAGMGGFGSPATPIRTRAGTARRRAQCGIAGFMVAPGAEKRGRGVAVPVRGGRCRSQDAPEPLRGNLVTPVWAGARMRLPVLYIGSAVRRSRNAAARVGQATAFEAGRFVQDSCYHRVYVASVGGHNDAERGVSDVGNNGARVSEPPRCGGFFYVWT